MSTYYIGSMAFSDGSDILHYGVVGMKWGVRQRREYNRDLRKRKRMGKRADKRTNAYIKAKNRLDSYSKRPKIAIEPETLMNKTKRVQKYEKLAIKAVSRYIEHNNKMKDKYGDIVSAFSAITLDEIKKNS